MGAADRALRCLGCACEVACGAPGRRRRGQEPHLWRPLHQAGLRASPGLSPAPIPGSKAPFLTHPSCKLVSIFPCFPLVLLRAVWLVSLSSGSGGISQGEGWWCLTPWLLSPGGEGPRSLRRVHLFSGRILQSSRSHGWGGQTRWRRKGACGVLERARAESVCMGWWGRGLGQCRAWLPAVRVGRLPYCDAHAAWAGTCPLGTWHPSPRPARGSRQGFTEG